jgi:hypothetical protein
LNKQYRCKHFGIYELVPEHIWQKRGEKAWELLNPLMLITLDRLRDRYGQMKMNNYRWNGGDQWRGLRTPESSYYSVTSKHSQGNAADPIFKYVSAEQVRKDMEEHPDWDCFEHITEVELGVGWFHFACSNCDAVKKYYP